MSNIDNTQDVIDSRDIIERIEELEAARKPWVAGWNVPGYMPDVMPERFATADEAREYIAAELEELADECETQDAYNECADAANAIRRGDGEYCATIGRFHYFVSYDEVLAFDDESAAREYETLKTLAEECAGYAPDWKYGETLIRDSYFKEYAQQLAEDIGAIDRNAAWPMCCIDWDQAAEELKQDYTSVDYDGVTYWIRS